MQDKSISISYHIDCPIAGNAIRKGLFPLVCTVRIRFSGEWGGGRGKMPARARPCPRSSLARRELSRLLATALSAAAAAANVTNANAIYLT